MRRSTRGQTQLTWTQDNAAHILARRRRGNLRHGRNAGLAAQSPKPPGDTLHCCGLAHSSQLQDRIPKHQPGRNDRTRGELKRRGTNRTRLTQRHATRRNFTRCTAFGGMARRGCLNITAHDQLGLCSASRNQVLPQHHTRRGSLPVCRMQDARQPYSPRSSLSACSLCVRGRGRINRGCVAQMGRACVNTVVVRSL